MAVSKVISFWKYALERLWLNVCMPDWPVPVCMAD